MLRNNETISIQYGTFGTTCYGITCYPQRLALAPPPVLLVLEVPCDLAILPPGHHSPSSKLAANKVLARCLASAHVWQYKYVSVRDAKNIRIEIIPINNQKYFLNCTRSVI